MNSKLGFIVPVSRIVGAVTLLSVCVFIASPGMTADHSKLTGGFSLADDQRNYTWLDRQDAVLAGNYTNIAQADSKKPKGDPAKCLTLKSDPNVDMGVLMRAGCKPTLAQMSKLMDNPLGNVAMLFTQFDFSRLKNDSNGKTADQYLLYRHCSVSQETQRKLESDQSHRLDGAKRADRRG